MGVFEWTVIYLLGLIAALRIGGSPESRGELWTALLLWPVMLTLALFSKSMWDDQ